MVKVTRLEADPGIGVARIDGANLSHDEIVGHLAQIFPLVNAAIESDIERFGYPYEGRVPMDVNLPEKVERWAPRIQASGPLMETGHSIYGAYHLDGEGQPRKTPTDMLGMLIMRRGDNENFPDTVVLAHNMFVYPNDPADQTRSIRKKGIAQLLIREGVASVPPEFSVRADVAHNRTEVMEWVSRLGFELVRDIAPKEDPTGPGAGFEEAMLQVPAATLRRRLGIDR